MEAVLIRCTKAKELSVRCLDLSSNGHEDIREHSDLKKTERGEQKQERGIYTTKIIVLISSSGSFSSTDLQTHKR